MSATSAAIARLPYDDALRAALPLAQALPPRSVRLSDALGTVLAEPIVADRDQPPFDRAQMDGYALRHADLAIDRALPVSATIAAGVAHSDPLVAGTCVAVATGAALPSGADTVIQHELSDRGNPSRFSATVPLGNAVHPRGADAKRGTIVVQPGTRLTARHLGIAASVGAVTPTVVDRPQVAVLTSGDEVVDPATTPQPQQIRNSNAALMAALLPSMGAKLGTMLHLKDERQETIAALDQALARHDLVVSVGGISAGDRDRFVEALAALNLQVVVRGVALRPGGPLTIAHRSAGDRTSILVALPGNPVSALVCAHLFVWPLLRALGGLASTLPWRDLRLAAEALGSASRQGFRPARLDEGGCATLPRWHGSGDLIHTGPTAGLVRLPSVDGTIPAGSVVPFLPWADAPGGE